jgi:hypothetical protein
MFHSLSASMCHRSSVPELHCTNFGFVFNCFDAGCDDGVVQQQIDSSYPFRGPAVESSNSVIYLSALRQACLSFNILYVARDLRLRVLFLDVV